MPTALNRPKSLVSAANRTVSLADAKANFCSLVNNVQLQHGSVTILRRGKPVAQLIPIAERPASLYGSMRGTVEEIGDIVGPTGEEWIIADE